MSDFLSYLIEQQIIHKESEKALRTAIDFIVKDFLVGLPDFDSRTICYHWREYMRGKHGNNKRH